MVLCMILQSTTRVFFAIDFDGGGGGGRWWSRV